MDGSDIGSTVANGTASTSVPRRRRETLLQKTVKWAVVAALIAAIVGLFSGLPPWPFTIAVVLGGVVTVPLFAVGRGVVATICAITAIIAASWFSRPTVAIRAPDADDPVRERYFNIVSNENPSAQITYKNIAVARGTFTLGTRLTATLYYVKSGEVRSISDLTVGRSPNVIGEPYWVDMKVTLALGNWQVPEGRVTQLGSAGHRRGVGHAGEMVNDVQPHATQTLPGRLSAGTRRLVYVEGDDGFTVDRSMTVEDFAEVNEGNYLVVEAQVR